MTPFLMRCAVQAGIAHANRPGTDCTGFIRSSGGRPQQAEKPPYLFFPRFPALEMETATRMSSVNQVPPLLPELGPTTSSSLFDVMPLEMLQAVHALF